jgi:hypothetical protein
VTFGFQNSSNLRTYLIDQSLLILFIYSINQKKVLHEPYLSVVAVAEEEASVDGGSGTGGGRRRARWWHMRRAVATGGVESDEDLETLGMKSEMTWRRLLFIDSKISAAVLN